MRVSIIMATRNSAAFLPSALASLQENLHGLGLAYEILLADGGSEDGTIDIARHVPNLTIVSRTDGGIYDGMNRCLDAATGDIFHILNSDDLLLPGALDGVLKAFSRSPEIDCVSGGALFGTSIDAAIARLHPSELKAPGTLFGIPAINARFFRRQTFRSVGNFRTDIGLGADREWLLRLAMLGARGVALDRPVYFYRQHRGSQTLAGTRVGRNRVYRADIELADAILARDDGQDSETLMLARSLKSVANVKLRLSGSSQRSGGEPYPSLLAHPKHLARGLRLWMQWRGVLSGF